MNNDKIIVVTGEPRSGTSLMMQTLKHLGVEVVGEMVSSSIEKRLKNSSEFTEDERKEVERCFKHTQKMNPIGFYEIPGIVVRGVRGRVAEKYKGKAIKIVTSGLPLRSQGGVSFGTDMEQVGKIILCLRNPKHIAISQQDLISNIEMADVESNEWKIGGMFKPSPMAYLGRTGGFLVWLDQHPEVKEKILAIDYEDMHLDSETQINKIVEFLEIFPTDEQIKVTKDNIIPSLRRSNKEILWDSEQEYDGEIAMEIYNSLKSMNTTACRALVEDRMHFHQMESVRWLDDDYGLGTWLVMNAELYRVLSIEGNESLLQILSNTFNRRKAGMISISCEYRTESNEEYTIRRPGDIGDLIRKRIWCLRDEDYKSCEECEHCWNHGQNKIDKFDVRSNKEEEIVDLIEGI